MSGLINLLKLADIKKQQIGVLRDHHFRTIADNMVERLLQENPEQTFEGCCSIAWAAAEYFVISLEWLDDTSFFEVIGCEERLKIHEFAALRVTQDNWNNYNILRRSEQYDN